MKLSIDKCEVVPSPEAIYRKVWSDFGSQSKKLKNVGVLQKIQITDASYPNPISLCHITSVLKQLYWLPVKQIIILKLRLFFSGFCPVCDLIKQLVMLSLFKGINFYWLSSKVDYPLPPKNISTIFLKSTDNLGWKRWCSVVLCSSTILGDILKKVSVFCS